LPSHPDVTQAEAEDPIFAVHWTVEQFSEGNAHLWTCWRNLFL